MVESLKPELPKERRVKNLSKFLGYVESGVVTAAVVFGAATIFIPRIEVAIAGAVAVTAASVWALARWDVRKVELIE